VAGRCWMVEVGATGQNSPKSLEAKPLVEIPGTCQTEPGRKLRGLGHGAAPTERFTHTRCALAPTVPRRRIGGKAAASKGRPNLLALALRPSCRLNSYGRPLCKVPPVADFVRPYTFRIETCDDMHIPKPPASLIPATELGVRPWLSVCCTYQGRNFSKAIYLFKR
jgi:hypothetical protein